MGISFHVDGIFWRVYPDEGGSPEISSHPEDIVRALDTALAISARANSRMKRREGGSSEVVTEEKLLR